MKSNRPVVFLGPSLPLTEAVRILDADYRPPIKRGDIDGLLSDPPPAIGIIDGEFFQNLAISPKEVLRGLESGITIAGASSLGALRAAELHQYGMIGVGTVFHLYRSGRIDADDEVAVVLSPGDFRPLSEAMVNIRLAFTQARADGLIDRRTCRRLLQSAKSMYFPERSYANLWKKNAWWLPADTASTLRQYLAERAPDVKRDDARLLLREICRVMAV
ncbi:MAG TPA: TfuA-related McrA-glycine thioamidation protein [Candidatus Acidoferrales bacterium]|nr:TfuA-related McrA-glycine thioamidation protein [Candidatus Acidoferrales bacterium]